MKTLDKLSLIIKVLKEMGCEPENIAVSNAPDNKLLITMHYKNAHKINRQVFDKLVNDKNAELHIPTISLTSKGSRKSKNLFHIFY